MGTVAALGGTPLALVYQDRSGPEMRSTLAVSFVVGILMSLAGPALAGQVEVRHVVLALELLPGLLAGLLISRWVVHRLEERRLHPAVLIFAAVAGVVITLLGSRAQAIRGAAYENDPGKAPARSVSCVRRVGRGPGDTPYRFSHLTACTMGRQYGPAYEAGETPVSRAKIPTAPSSRPVPRNHEAAVGRAEARHGRAGCGRRTLRPRLL